MNTYFPVHRAVVLFSVYTIIHTLHPYTRVPTIIHMQHTCSRMHTFTFTNLSILVWNIYTDLFVSYTYHVYIHLSTVTPLPTHDHMYTYSLKHTYAYKHICIHSYTQTPLYRSQGVWWYTEAATPTQRARCRQSRGSTWPGLVSSPALQETTNWQPDVLGLGSGYFPFCILCIFQVFFLIFIGGSLQS